MATDNKITLQDLAEKLAIKSGMTKRNADAFCRSFFDVIEKALLEENLVKIKGFGTFKLITVSERESVNVNTGERIQIQSHSKISFTPDEKLRDLVNRPFAHFENVILNDDVEVAEMENVSDVANEAPENVTTLEDDGVSIDSQKNEEIITDDLLVHLDGDDTSNNVEEEKHAESHNETIEESLIEIDSQSFQEEESDVHVEEQTIEDEVCDDNNEEENTETESYEDYGDDEEEVDYEENSQPWLRWLVYFIFFVVLLVIGYVAGYYKVVDKLLRREKVELVNPVKVDVKNDTTPAPLDSTQIVAKERAEKLSRASEFDQVQDGDFVIVGTKNTHTLKAGEGLYKVAKSYYGDKAFAKYIEVHNKITNPDVVPVGTELKIPELVEAEKSK